MDNLSSLSNGLPRRATTQQELQDLDRNLVSEFKTAASAVTRLFKLAGAKTELSRKQGYVEALQDLLTALEEESNLNVQSWALDKLVSLCPDEGVGLGVIGVEMNDGEGVLDGTTGTAGAEGNEAASRTASPTATVTTTVTPTPTTTSLRTRTSSSIVSGDGNNIRTNRNINNNPINNSINTTTITTTTISSDNNNIQSHSHPTSIMSSTSSTPALSSSQRIISSPPAPPAPPSGMFTFRTDLELPTSTPEIPDRFEFDFNHPDDETIFLGDKRRHGSPNKYDNDVIKRLRRDY